MFLCALCACIWERYILLNNWDYTRFYSSIQSERVSACVVVPSRVKDGTNEQIHIYTFSIISVLSLTLNTHTHTYTHIRKRRRSKSGTRRVTMYAFRSLTLSFSACMSLCLFPFLAAFICSCKLKLVNGSQCATDFVCCSRCRRCCCCCFPFFFSIPSLLLWLLLLMYVCVSCCVNMRTLDYFAWWTMSNVERAVM